MRSVRRFFEIEGVTQMTVIGAQAFTSLIPFLLVSAAFVPTGDTDMGDRFVARFDLHGSTARNVQALFNSSTQVESAVSWVSVVILVLSSLSFTRAVQRMYQRSYRLGPGSARQDAQRGLAWLFLFAIWLIVVATVRADLRDASGLVLAVGGETLLGFAIWIITPRLLLGPRVPWRRLAIGAAVSGVAGLIVSVGSGIVMPIMLTWSSDKYGLIGIALALQSWLLAVALVIVLGAVVGAAAGEEPST